jgi:hypothetical protein
MSKNVPSHRDEGTGTWDSPKIKAIEERWRREMPDDSRPTEEGDPSGMFEQLVDILREELSPKELRELATCYDATWDYRLDFADIVHENLVVVFVKSADREGLVTLLATRCRRLVRHREIEYYLARSAEAKGGGKLKDPILVLGEAYRACKSPEVRKEIAAAVHRAFAASGVTGKDDAELVENAMRWCKEHKGKIKVNPDYGRGIKTLTNDYDMPLYLDATSKDRPSPKTPPEKGSAKP